MPKLKYSIPPHSHPAITKKLEAIRSSLDDLLHKFFGNGQEGLLVKIARVEESAITHDELRQLLNEMAVKIAADTETKIRLAISEHQLFSHDSEEAKRELAKEVKEITSQKIRAPRRSTDKLPPNMIPEKIWRAFMFLNDLAHLYPLLVPLFIFVCWMLGYTFEQTIELLKLYLPVVMPK